MAAAVGLPILVLIVALATKTWYPTGDQAQAELRMRSLLSDPPLVGAAGRIEDDLRRQGNHPGPLMFWVTWPLYAALGRSAWAFEAATALVNLAWLTASVWLVKRRAGIAACAWYGIGALVLIGGYGLDGLTQPWNPWVALLPFTVLLLATWSVLEGDRWAPVLAVAAASYALQGHVGYLPVTVPLVAICLALPAWRWLRSRSASPGAGDGDRDDEAAGRTPVRTWLAPVLVAVAVGAVAWSGPIADVLTNDPNNVSKLIDNFGSPNEDPIGVGRGIEAILQSTNPAGAWVWGGAEVSGSVVPGAVLLIGWGVVSVLVALRRADRRLDHLNVVLGLTGLLGTFAVTRVFGALYLYTFRWIAPIVALVVFSLGWGLALLVPKPSPKAAARWAGVAVVALVGLSAVMSVRVARQDIPYDQSSRSVEGLATPVAERLDPDARYLIRWDDPAYLGGIGFGLLLELERRGFDVGADPRFEAAVEPSRVRCDGDYDALLTVVTGPRNIETYRADPAYVELAATDPRADPERWQDAYDELLPLVQEEEPEVTADSLEGQMNFLLLAPGWSDQVRELAGEVVLSGVPSAVFLQDPAPPSDLDPNDARNGRCFR